MIHQMSVPCMFIANTAINGSLTPWHHLAGHSVGTLLPLVYPSRAQHSLPWHPGSSRSKQESRSESSSACFIHLLFQCFGFWNLMCLKSMDLQICLKTPLVWRSSRLTWQNDLVWNHQVWSPTRVNFAGSSRRWGNLRWIFWTVEVGRWSNPKKNMFLSCLFPMCGLLFWNQIFAPKTKPSVKTKRSILLFGDVALQKNHVHDVFCLFLFAFRGF